MKKNVAVFSSGRGGNFNNLCDYFNNNDRIIISLLITNNLDSMSKKIADRNNIETIYVNKEMMSSESFEKSLIKRNICFLVLAGFILKLPAKLVGLFEKKIINLFYIEVILATYNLIKRILIKYMFLLMVPKIQKTGFRMKMYLIHGHLPGFGHLLCMIGRIQTKV